MDAKELAESCCVLLSTVGSELWGTSIGTGDHDEMGVCVEPPEYVMGLRKFAQWEHHTKSEGERSGPGDRDVTIYSLRKYVSLAVKGNPTILALLFAPDKFVSVKTSIGFELQNNAPLFAAKTAATPFLGYLQAQRDRMMGLRGGKHTNRPELIDLYGFDVKYASHMIRLGLQGVEFLSTGKITLPIPEPMGQWLRELRKGEHTKEEALTMTSDLEAMLLRLRDDSPLPPEPDYNAINRWLVDAHMEHWERWL